MRVLDILKSATEYLVKSGLSDAGADAELIVLHSASIDRMTAYRDNPVIGDGVRDRVVNLLERRAKGEPVQYIVGSVDFLDLRIEVGKGVLIPRPETELVAREGIRILRGIARGPSGPDLRIIDLCSGTGCISLALAKEFPEAEVFGTDISGLAVAYCLKNADINSIKNVTFCQGSLYEPLKGFPPFDMIVSNPPYIVSSEIGGLQREIREWEPINALDGGSDGLDFYRKIFAGAGEHLKEKGVVIVELGFGQSRDVSTIAERAGFRNIFIKKDFSGIDRVLTAEAAPASQSSHLQG